MENFPAKLILADKLGIVPHPVTIALWGIAGNGFRWARAGLTPAPGSEDDAYRGERRAFLADEACVPWVRVEPQLVVPSGQRSAHIRGAG